MVSNTKIGDCQIPWMEPEILELDVRETFQFPNLGADIGGNPYPDCQRS